MRIFCLNYVSVYTFCECKGSFICSITGFVLLAAVLSVTLYVSLSNAIRL